ncbi:hypothetical protein MTO96_039511, partial [Rhipicephalus appendiculatus]
RYNIRDGSRAAWDIYQRYGPIVAQQLPGRRVIIRLFNANDIRTLYQEEGKTPNHVGSLPLKLYHQSRKPQFFANDGLLHAKGDEWRRIRSVTHNSVSAPNAVQGYADGVARVADDTISLISSARDDKGEVEDCHALMKRWSFESTVFLAVDKRLGVLDHHFDSRSTAGSLFVKIQEASCILDALSTNFPYYLYISTPAWRRFVRRGDEILRLLLPLITEAAEGTVQDQGKENTTLIASLQRDGKLSFKEIFTFIFDFIVAGFDT